MTVITGVRARLKTQRHFLEMFRKHGMFHPATFAAYGRVFVVWGAHPPEIPNEVPVKLRIACRAALMTAVMRARHGDGYNNRARRKHGFSGRIV